MSEQPKVKGFEVRHGGIAKIFEDGSFTFVIENNLDPDTADRLCNELNQAAGVQLVEDEPYLTEDEAKDEFAWIVMRMSILLDYGVEPNLDAEIMKVLRVLDKWYAEIGHEWRLDKPDFSDLDEDEE